MQNPLVLHLTGSPQDRFHEQLSLTYARDAEQSLKTVVGQTLFLHVNPQGQRFLVPSLKSEDLRAAKPMTLPQILEAINIAKPDLALPQMFCRTGMIQYRCLLEFLQIPFIGNLGEVMALTFDKYRTKSVVSSFGIPVPEAKLVSNNVSTIETDIIYPVIVKPNSSDNSAGVSLVNKSTDLQAAVLDAQTHSPEVLIEKFIPPGREVRCGVIEHQGNLIPLPLQEYYVDSTSPIRFQEDKLIVTDNELQGLTSRIKKTSCQVDVKDPITKSVQELSQVAHRALRCRHYSLFDFRIDESGKPWFLEAGLYCSFAKSSIISTMAEYHGWSLNQLFQKMIGEVIPNSVPSTVGV
ncbi:MAG: D-alanine--D-alanine ligase [Planctomycetota bacterium]